MDILLIEDNKIRKDYLINAVTSLNDNNLKYLEETSVIVESYLQEKLFNKLKQSIIDLSSQELVVIADVNLGLPSRLVAQIRTDYANYEVPTSQDQTLARDFIGVIALLIEIIRNEKIEKVLIVLASTDVQNLDTIIIKEYLPLLAKINNRHTQVIFEMSNSHKLNDMESYRGLVQAAVNKFREVHILPIHYAIEQLLIAHTIEETKLAHAENSLNKDNLVQGESSSNKFIDEGTLFYRLIDSDVQISDTCCKALFNCEKSEPIKIETLKQIFIKFGYGVAIPPNFQAAQINFPSRNGMIFVAHLLRCLEHIRKHQNNIEILLELEIDLKSQAIKKTSFTVELKTFKTNDIYRLRNGIETYTGGNQSGMLIRHLRELISCNTSIVNDYKKNYSRTYDLEQILEKIYPKQIDSGSYSTTTVIFERIIELEFLEQSNRLKLSWKPPQ